MIFKWSKYNKNKEHQKNLKQIKDNFTSNEVETPVELEIKKCCCEEKIEKIEESIDNLNKKIKDLENKIQTLENYREQSVQYNPVYYYYYK